MECSIKIEMIALLINSIVMLFHFDKRNLINKRHRLFSVCLIITAVSISLDILTILTLKNANILPAWINHLANTLYFAVIYITFSFVARYCFYVLFEYTDDDWCLTRATHIITVLCGLLLGLLLMNIWTGWIFSIQGTQYIRGSLNKIGYFVLLAEVGMLCLCYFRHRKTASRSVRRLIEIIPALVLMLVLTQFAFPDVLLNGIISALVNLVLFINFQSNKIGLDDLTKLYNRVSFFQDFAYFRKQTASFHLILVHLDEYENINKKYGVRSGDLLLFHIAKYLEEFDVNYRAYRVGNTRFLLLGRDVENNKVETNVQKVLQRFNEKWKIPNGDCDVHVSIAHMKVNDSKQPDSSIIAQLEYGLSKAREMNGNRVVYFDDKLDEMYQRNNYVLSQVKKAIENESFEVYFQPVYECESHDFTTAESLLRLFDEQGRFISPGEFIPLAEKTGLIDEISWIVLKKVFHFLGTHKDLPINSISVNLSMQQLTDSTFVHRLHTWQKEYDVPFEKIRIEITERSIAEKYQLVQLTMQQLVSEGLKFYLDDFGIGYSNLSNMLALPFETVKLDMSLVQEIDKDFKKYRIVKYLSQMLHSAGFVVVTEGVETNEESMKVQELGVDRIQGFYYAKPMPKKEYIDFIMKSGSK